MDDINELKLVNTMLYDRKIAGKQKDRQRRSNQSTKRQVAKSQYQIFRSEVAVALTELQYHRWLKTRSSYQAIFSLRPYLCGDGDTY
jgi:hypothetical protein